MSALEAEIRAAVAAAVEPLRQEIRALRDALGNRPGERLTQADLARLFDLSPSALSMRLKRGKCALARLPYIEDRSGSQPRKLWDRGAAEALLASSVRR